MLRCAVAGAANPSITRLLLERGAVPDARRPLPGDRSDGRIPPPVPPLAAAVESDCPADLIELLLSHGADPSVPGQDGSSPYRMAVRWGRADIVHLMEQHGADAGVTDTDRFLSACRQEDHAEAERLMRHNPGLTGQLTGADHAALVEAAGQGEPGRYG